MHKKFDTPIAEQSFKARNIRLATKPLQTDPSRKEESCCMGTKGCTVPMNTVRSTPSTAPTYASGGSEGKKGPKTRITVKHDVGFGNHLYLRGKGANLSWTKGYPLKNAKIDEWVWETDQAFTSCEFKVLINDITYEIGDNHTLTCGASIQYTPRF